MAGIFGDAFSERFSPSLNATFYPLGLPLEITTNSAEIMAAAAESWSLFHQEFDRDPVRIRIVVEPGIGPERPEPVYRRQRELLLIVSDRQNFAVCDLGSRFGWCLASSDAVADTAW